jgi:spermidine synthase
MKSIGTEWLIEASGCDAELLRNPATLQHLPSFGVWGFAPAKLAPFSTPSCAPARLKFLDQATMAGMFILPADLAPVEVELNRLDNQALVHYYETEWQRLQ